jgi:hypothetical protein
VNIAMPWKLTIRLAELAITATLVAALILAWHADRKDRAQLATDLAAARQSLTQVEARQHDRDSDLVKTLADLAAQKRAALTPDQILQALPKQIPLPEPITIQPPPNREPNPVADIPDPSTIETGKPNKPQPQSQPPATIPAADLKPLYDFAVDCNACQAELAVAKSDLADEKSKSATITKERDEAVRTAKGGTGLQRFARAAKWLFIGAAAGALAARATH